MAAVDALLTCNCYYQILLAPSCATVRALAALLETRETGAQALALGDGE